MLESKEETEQSLKDILKIDAGKSVESLDVAPAVGVKTPEIIDEPEKVEKVDTKVTLMGINSRIRLLKLLMSLKRWKKWMLKVTLMGINSRIRLLKFFDEPEKAKSMDAKSDIDGDENQEKTPEIVDEPEKVEKVDAKSDTDGNKIGTVIQDTPPDSIDASIV